MSRDNRDVALLQCEMHVFSLCQLPGRMKGDAPVRALWYAATLRDTGLRSRVPRACGACPPSDHQVKQTFRHRTYTQRNRKRVDVALGGCRVTNKEKAILVLSRRRTNTLSTSKIYGQRRRTTQNIGETPWRTSRRRRRQTHCALSSTRVVGRGV